MRIRTAIPSLLCLCGSLAWLTPSTAAALAAQAMPQQSLEFHLARHALKRGHFTLDSGIEVDSSEWDSLIITSFVIGTDNTGAPDIATCTASFVGPAVVVTAAHCLFDPKTNGVRSALLGIDGWPDAIAMKCDVDPTYASAPHPQAPPAPRSSADFALCHLDMPSGALHLLDIDRYESLELNQIYPRNSTVVMTGYGCTNLRVGPDGWNWDPADGNLRVGDAALDSVPGAVGPESDYYAIYAHAHDHPALCPGDSGGPLLAGITARAAGGDRRLIGINSSIGQASGPYDFVSSIAAIGTGDFSDFLTKTYLKHHAGDHICGVDWPAGTAPCR